MDTITIDDSIDNIREMMERGMFHSWQDGKWRYSPHGREPTVYVNDPTARFPIAATFANGIEGKAAPEAGLFAQIHGDKTRGVRAFSEDVKTVFRIYGPKNEGERAFREWLLATMRVPA